MDKSEYSKKWREKNKSKLNEYHRKYYQKTKEKRNELAKEYRKKNKAHKKDYSLKWLYGISLDDFHRMLDNQNNKCLICHRDFNIRLRPYVDHNHITGKIRGVLCRRCNQVLGLVYEDTSILNYMVKYLNRDIQ